MALIELFTFFTEQDLLNAQTHCKKEASKRGLINNGLAGLNIHLIPCFMAPGAANGMI